MTTVETTELPKREQIRRLMEESIATGNFISVRQIATTVNCSRDYVHSYLNAHHGEDFANRYRRLRLESELAKI